VVPVSVSIPVLFLGLSVIWLMFTINALRPVLRIGPLLGPSFFAGWLTGELALHHLLGQMAIATLLIWLGGWQQSPSLIALAVACLSWAGLLGIFVQSRRADRVVEEALRKELGTAYIERIPEELKTGLAERWSLRQRLLPLAIYDHRVECIKNIVYSRAGGIDLKLDVYRPKDLPRGTVCPTVLFVHGGAWMIGNKDHQGKPLANRLAAHGWVVVSTNYRLSPRFTFPDHIIDVKNAIRWIREHGKEYGANPDFIVITGGSAGGHLAALAALTPNDPKWQPGFENVDTRVQACVPFYGAFDFTDRNGYWKHSLLVPMIERYILKKRLRDAHAEFDAASPMSHVNEKAPPFFVIHGEMDSLAPVEEARHFVELLRAKSKAPVVYAEIPGAQHAFEVFPSERTGHVLAGVERFVGAVYGEWWGEREQAAEVHNHA
jgi:acetyl esterase/lipase